MFFLKQMKFHTQQNCMEKNTCIKCETEKNHMYLLANAQWQYPCYEINKQNEPKFLYLDKKPSF